MNYFEFVEELMECTGCSEEVACREADAYFFPDDYNADDYDT